ncbi:hypothetical protein CCACVL1_28146, partial [Corchorus capsularis]
ASIKGIEGTGVDEEFVGKVEARSTIRKIKKG